MRAPAIANALRLDVSSSTIICACCLSLPAGAPSSQSQLTSKSRPIDFCSSSAFAISFSDPAKCSHAGSTGKGFSPAKSAALGWEEVAMAFPRGFVF